LGEKLLSKDKKIILPEFLETTIAVMHRGASEEKLAEVRAQYASQIAFNEKMAAERKDENIQNRQARRSSVYFYALSTDPNNPELINGGTVTSPSNILGTQDLSFTRFLTSGSDQGASVFGALSGTAPSGAAVDVLAKIGSTGAGKFGNIINVHGSEYGGRFDPWYYIGTVCIVTPYAASYPVWYRVGYTEKAFPFITVGTHNFAGLMAEYNDVLVDCVEWQW